MKGKCHRTEKETFINTFYGHLGLVWQCFWLVLSCKSNVKSENLVKDEPQGLKLNIRFSWFIHTIVHAIFLVKLKRLSVNNNF